MDDAIEGWKSRHPEVDLGPRPTLSGLPVDGVHGPREVDTDRRYLDEVGFPGEYPFTRGIAAGMHRDEPWVMGMYSGRASPAATNLRIRALLAGGQRGFSVALDLPTQCGLDSDHPLAVGEVGKVGVPIDSAEDMTVLLDGIALDDVSQIRTTANAIGPLAVALFVVAAERNGYRSGDFKVLLQNDVLKEYLARGTYIFPPRAGLRASVDVIEYCTRDVPHWEPIEFCGYHIRDAGSSAVQELAFAFANGREYLDAATARGLVVDDFAANVYLFLSAHIDLLEEVAKFRAARRLWARLLRDEYGATLDETCAAKIFVYTLGSVQAAREPLTNVARIGFQALAAALGGVQTLATSSYDEALQLPSAEAAHLSLRTQQVVAYETGVTRTADPLGGSYVVEHLTDQMEAAVQLELARIAEQGGALAALESGWLRHELDEEAYRQQLDVEHGRRTVVGVNRFVREDQPIELGAIVGEDDGVEAEQVERLVRWREQRDGAATDDCLHRVAVAAAGTENIVPAVIDAVRARATVGEVTDALASVWGLARSRG